MLQPADRAIGVVDHVNTFCISRCDRTHHRSFLTKQPFVSGPFLCFLVLNLPLCVFCMFFLFYCSSDELYAYLSHRRPDLCILEGEVEEEEEEGDEEEFVLVNDREEEEELDRSLKCGRMVEDWEVSKWFKLETFSLFSIPLNH